MEIQKCHDIQNFFNYVVTFSDFLFKAFLILGSWLQYAPREFSTQSYEGPWIPLKNSLKIGSPWLGDTPLGRSRQGGGAKGWWSQWLLLATRSTPQVVLVISWAIGAAKHSLFCSGTSHKDIFRAP